MDNQNAAIGSLNDIAIAVDTVLRDTRRDRATWPPYVTYHLSRLAHLFAVQPGTREVDVPDLPENWWSIELTKRLPGDELLSGEVVEVETIESDIWCTGTDDILSGIGPTIESAIAAALAQDRGVE